MASVPCPMTRPIGHMRISVSVESPRASQPFSFSIANYIQFQLPVFEIHGDGLCYGRKRVKCGELSFENCLFLSVIFV